jgi:hypothetical protein
MSRQHVDGPEGHDGAARAAARVVLFYRGTAIYVALAVSLILGLMLNDMSFSHGGCP